MEHILEKLNEIIWGVPVLIMILLIGILYSVRTGFIQFRLFPKACEEFIASFRHKADGISGYRALCTALAATVGTGNIVGVAGAIAIGGPGVVFWMWICAILGMVIKFAEVTLAMNFREKNPTGDWVGGPMYIIQNGLHPKYKSLAAIYAFFGVVASFGIGNATQINAVMGGIQMLSCLAGRPIGMVATLIISLLIGTLVVLIFRNGANGIGSWAEKLVPPASVIYILLTLWILGSNIKQIPDVLKLIVKSAFSPSTATCGIVSSALISLRVGASRGVFTNEAGMGTASIAHSGAMGVDSVQQGLLGTIEVIFDTIVMCTLTAFAILCSGVSIPYGSDPGIHLTLYAFSEELGKWSSYLIIALVCIFAFATVLGWGLYGMRCMEYLFGIGTENIFIALQFCAVLAGSFIGTSGVWLFSEIVNGLMAIPNLIALLLLLPIFLRETQNYMIKA